MMIFFSPRSFIDWRKFLPNRKFDPFEEGTAITNSTTWRSVMSAQNVPIGSCYPDLIWWISIQGFVQPVEARLAQRVAKNGAIPRPHGKVWASLAKIPHLLAWSCRWRPPTSPDPSAGGGCSTSPLLYFGPLNRTR